jgi:FtsP/CotA-like multicopper oxidase with cupredoxin domain
MNRRTFLEAAGVLMPPASAPDIDPIRVHEGGRYRLGFRNESDDQHPIHIHRHLFELVSIDGRPTAGVMKDTVVVNGFGRVEVDLVANNPGLTLFHCHQQRHMDYGFMTLIEYTS